MLHHRLSDLPPKDVSPLRWRERGEVLALEQDGAGDLSFWAEKIEDCAGHTALAGPGFADDGERPSRLEREADIAHRGDLPFALAIADREVTDLEQRRVHRRLSSFGSSTSRKPSPTRLMLMTVRLIAIPGASDIQGAVSTKARPLLIIRPQSA